MNDAIKLVAMDDTPTSPTDVARLIGRMEGGDQKTIAMFMKARADFAESEQRCRRAERDLERETEVLGKARVAYTAAQAAMRKMLEDSK